MLDAIFYWTGVTAWVSIGCSLAFILALLVRLIVIATAHTAAVYSFGFLTAEGDSLFRRIKRVFRLWWYIFLEQPQYLERKDDLGGRIYRPGRKPTGREQYDG